MTQLLPQFSIKKPAEFEMLSMQQKQVIEAFEEGKNLFVTGAAGSGKSYLLHYLKRHYEHLGLAITASTGIAAVNIAGATIHSWAGIGLANMPVEQIIENLFGARFARIRRKINRTKALAIDEISMISAEVFTILDRVFQAVRENNAPIRSLA
jgi:thymidine kinase